MHKLGSCSIGDECRVAGLQQLTKCRRRRISFMQVEKVVYELYTCDIGTRKWYSTQQSTILFYSYGNIGLIRTDEEILYIIGSYSLSIFFVCLF